MSALLGKIAGAIAGAPSISETDRGIIEAMIEIGAETAEIAETFGYEPEIIDLIRSTQPLSPYRVPPS